MSQPAAVWPRIVPIFTLGGAMLLPGGRLPLTVFEPRYLAMTDDALGNGRWLALVQPSPNTDSDGLLPGLYSVGTLGRITAFGDSGDGRYLITVTGVARCRLMAEAGGRLGYRRAVVDYSPFDIDRQPERQPPIDRHRLAHAVGGYFDYRGIATDMAKLEQLSDMDFVSALAMAAPLSAEEKQALLEADTASQRAQLMTAMFEMALLSEAGPVLLH